MEGIGRFAECNTRQRDTLLSVEPKHSAKKSISVILGTFLSSVSSLPSVFKWTLGKVTIKSACCALVCRVYWAWHSAKCVNVDECFGLDTRQTLQPLPSVLVLHSANFSNFTECFGDDTRQSLQTLPSVLGLTLGKLEKLYRVFSVGHSAKSPSPCHPVIIFVPRVSFCRVFIDTRQTIAECAIKNTRQTTVLAEFLWEKNTVSAEKTSRTSRFLSKPNGALWVDSLFTRITVQCLHTCT